MSGVWVFKKNGVMEKQQQQGGEDGKRKVLVHLATGQVVSSYRCLDQILKGLGWERYHDHDHPQPHLFQFHRRSSIDLISLPKDFNCFSSIYMYDIVVKNPNIFHVRDIYP